MTDTSCYSPSIARICTPVDSTKQAVGTGWIIKNTSKTNDITFLTNAHVVAPGAHHTIELAWAHGRKMPAEVVALCYDRDIALLKLSREIYDAAIKDYLDENSPETKLIKSAPALELASSDMYKPIGTMVWCQGHPLGLPNQQVSWGNTRGVYNMPNGEQRYLIQAPINHGNSGGPVFTKFEGQNRVVGISTMKLSGKQVEGEGGMIIESEIRAILPTMMQHLEVPVDEMSKVSAIQRMLASVLGIPPEKIKIANGKLHKNTQTSKQVEEDHEQVVWLNDNWQHFNAKWIENVCGGTVKGEPRHFQAWFHRHVYDKNTENYLYNGESLFNFVVCAGMRNKFNEVTTLKNQVGGWKEVRLGLKDHVVSLNMQHIMHHTAVPHLIHAPILGFENIQPVSNVDYDVYYNCGKNVNGIIVNTVLPRSLYEKAGGKEGDLIYAFSVNKINCKDGTVQMKLRDTVKLDREGNFSEDGSGLGCKISLATMCHHLEWYKEGDEQANQIVFHVYRKGGKQIDLTSKFQPPAEADLPEMKMLTPFNNESKPPPGMKIGDIALAQCNVNIVKKFKLMEYFDTKKQYQFKVVCLGSSKHHIAPGSTLTRMSAISGDKVDDEMDVDKIKSWEEFTNTIKEFQLRCQGDDKPKFWKAVFERPGFKTTIIHKI